MITQADRLRLVNSGFLIFGKASHRADLLDPMKTNDGLIDYCLRLFVDKKNYFGTTAVNRDHPTWDGGPNGRGHNAGCALDGAPMNSAKPGDWTPANSPRMRKFLRDAVECGPFQIGLVGPSNDPANYYDSPANMKIVGSKGFHDDGGPHVHLGARKVVKGQYVD